MVGIIDFAGGRRYVEESRHDCEILWRFLGGVFPERHLQCIFAKVSR